MKRWPLSTIFLVSLYALVCYGALILAYAENKTIIPYLTIPIALVGASLNEGGRRRGIPQFLGNILAFVGLGFAAAEFFGDQKVSESRLLAGAHLVIYISWVVFLQRRPDTQNEDRVHWQMCALSLLQVAVASVLTEAPWYGPAITLYSVGAMWTLAVFSLVRAEQQFVIADRQFADAEGSGVRSELATDRSARWITWRFAGGVLCQAAVALIFSALFFAFTPRVWIGRGLVLAEDDTPLARGRASVVGLSEDVRLGQIGQVLESVAPVFEFSVQQSGSEEPWTIDRYLARLNQAEALFRGHVLTDYQRGHWKTAASDRADKLRQTVESSHLVEEIYRLEPNSGNVLFSVALPRACHLEISKPPSVVIDRYSGMILMPNEARDRSLVYSIGAELPAQSSGVVFAPVTEGVGGNAALTTQLLKLPETDLTAVKRSAAEQIAKAQAARGGGVLSNLDRARVLESWLRDGGEFTYSLKLESRNPTLDPIEEFVRELKVGHCEYFASALTLMLRSQGIPARMITGYKGGETRGDDRLIVQDRHAHAWVEALVEIPSLGGVRWITLDPTPAGREESVANIGLNRSVWQRLSSDFSDFWRRNVVNVDLGQQRRTIYGPLKSFGQFLWSILESIRDYFLALVQQWQELLRSPAKLFSTNGLRTLLSTLAPFVLLGLMIFATRRWWARHLNAWRQERDRIRRRKQFVEFYERLIGLLRKQGLLRQPSQTGLEFAEFVNQRLAAKLQPAGLVGLPAELTSLFYSVRFGDRELSPDEMQRIQQQLGLLEQSLADPGNRGSLRGAAAG